MSLEGIGPSEMSPAVLRKALSTSPSLLPAPKTVVMSRLSPHLLIRGYISHSACWLLVTSGFVSNIYGLSKVKENKGKVKLFCFVFCFTAI